MRCQRIEFDFTDNGIRQLTLEAYLGFRIEMELHVVPAVHDVGIVQTVDLVYLWPARQGQMGAGGAAAVRPIPLSGSS